MNLTQKQVNEQLPFLKIVKQSTKFSCLKCLVDSKNFVIDSTRYDELFNFVVPKKILKEQFRLPFDDIFINFLDIDENKNFLIKNYIDYGDVNERNIFLVGASIQKIKNNFISFWLFFRDDFYNSFTASLFFLENDFSLEFGELEDKMILEDDRLNRVYKKAFSLEEIASNVLFNKTMFNKFGNFLFNCVLFLNARNVIKKEVETKEHYTTKDANGQYRNIPINYYLCDVEINQEVIEYDRKLSLNPKKRAPFGFSFDVRGHWMSFKSPRYKLKRWQKTWVEPYMKGNGVYVPSVRFYEEAKKSIALGNEVTFKT